MELETVRSIRRDEGPVAIRKIGLIDYQAAWDLQRETAQARIGGTGPDTLFLLEHPHVYTAGKRTQPEDRPTDGSPVIEVDRGGRITWHGPGQLVGYPILALAEPLDVVDYVRRMEEALISVVHGLGLGAAGRNEKNSGVWLPADDRGPDRKIAAIGVRVQSKVTLHGFALNCDPDMSAYDRIVPCGLVDTGVTSLARELGRPVSLDEVADVTAEAMLAAFDGALPVREHAAPRPEAPAGLNLQLHPALR